MRRLKVEDIMTHTVVSAREDTRYKELVQLMAENRVSGLPVLDGEGRLVGIVTEADLLLAEEGEPKHRSLFLHWFAHPKRLAALRKESEGVRAEDIMTRDVVAARRHESVHAAAKVLLDAGVRRLPVIDDERRVVGIVSRRTCCIPTFAPTRRSARRWSRRSSSGPCGSTLAASRWGSTEAWFVWRGRWRRGA